MTDMLTTQQGSLAYDDYGGEGPLLLLLPGAGDVRSEHRFLASRLAAVGYRVVTMDLRGHGESTASWSGYGVAATAADIVAAIRGMDAGPATVIGNSFSPAAALWAAAEHPALVSGVVAISPHLDQDAGALQRLTLELTLRGPLAGPVWEKFYRGWYKSNPPSDLDEQVALLREMMQEPLRRKAVRATLLAHRDGLDEKLSALATPVLVIFGSEDDHFDTPHVAAADAAERTRGTAEIIDGAGHYPHVEYPEIAASMVRDFLDAD